MQVLQFLSVASSDPTEALCECETDDHETYWRRAEHRACGGTFEVVVCDQCPERSGDEGPRERAAKGPRDYAPCTSPVSSGI
jgi:hypothetical protein